MTSRSDAVTKIWVTVQKRKFQVYIGEDGLGYRIMERVIASPGTPYQSFYNQTRWNLKQHGRPKRGLGFEILTSAEKIHASQK